MPTGYTYMITEKDASFEQFVWACARAFGALIMMRDDPCGVPIPIEVEPDDYHLKALKTAQQELRDFEALSVKELEAQCKAYNASTRASYQESVRARAKETAKYEVMLAKVKAWKPPSPDHKGLRDFMIQQIETSMDRYEIQEHGPMTVVEYIAMTMDSAKRNVEYHRKGVEEEQERSRARTKWLQALVDSVPQPKVML